jgi:hypothetical protein
MDEVRNPDREVSRDVFMRDPGSVARRARIEGPLTVLDAKGKPFMVMSYPKPHPDPLDGIESER